MTNINVKNSLGRRVLISRFIWGFMVLSLIIVTFVSYLVIEAPQDKVGVLVSLPNFSSMTDLVFVLAAIAIIPIILFLRNSILSKNVIEEIIQNPPDNFYIGIATEQNAKSDETTKIRKIIFALSEKYFLTLIYSLALSETITLLGFILGLTTNNPVIIPFTCISLILNLLFFPKTDQFVESALEGKF